MSVRRVVGFAVLSGVLTFQPSHAGSRPAPGAVGKEVSPAEIERTLHAIDVDRTSGSEGERAAADYLVRKLTEYGVTHTNYDARLYLSWPGRAMTDTGGSDASILEMARVLQHHQGELERGVRFAWWTGHSFGRYAGSGWYVDRFLADLDRHCVAYTNLDGPGRRHSRTAAVAAAGWPGLADYARESAVRLTGFTPAPPRAGARVFRPGRDSDSAFQGVGIPFFSIGVPGPDKASGDIDAAGRIVYWHTVDDTYDKLDSSVLTLDTEWRLAQLYDLATARALPHRLAPIASAYMAALNDLSGGPFDLSQTIKLASRLEDVARRFDAAPRPTTDEAIDRFNRTVVRLTHALNSTLYTAAGRFDQDPAAELPVLPLLGRVKDLATLPRDGDEYGFVETAMIRGRNEVEATLRDATNEIESYLGQAR